VWVQQLTSAQAIPQNLGRMFRFLAYLVLIHATAAYVSKGFAVMHSTRLNLFGNPDNKPATKNEGGGKEGGGMFGGMGNLMESMKKAQEIAKQAEQVNKELAGTLIQGEDAGGNVVASFNGLGIPVSMKIMEGAAGMSTDELSKATTEAMITGHEKAQSQMMAKMSAMYQQAGVPMPPPQ
jgi:DNA-binding protein YbaB